MATSETNISRSRVLMKFDLRLKMSMNMVGEDYLIVLIFGMLLTFDKHTLTSYFYATSIQTCIYVRDQRCLSRTASICLSGGVRSGLMN